MSQYTIVRKTAWENVPAMEIATHYHPSDADVSAQAQLCYDETALYVRLSAREQNIRAEYTGVLDEVWTDSCLEFFFSPMCDGRYFNIEVNPNGAMCLGFGRSLQNLCRLVINSRPIRPVTSKTADGWTVEYAIPYDFVQIFFPDFSPAPGKIIRGNCYKCGDLTERPHWLTWAPIPDEKATFHCPQYFGIMQFA